MGTFSKLGIKLREHQRAIAATLALVGIAVAIFFAGTWAGSSGAFTLDPATALASHARHAPPPNAPTSDDVCSDKSMPSHKMGPNMPMPGAMPSDEAGPGMPSDTMCPDMPMGKTGASMPMDKPMRDEMRCEKE